MGPSESQDNKIDIVISKPERAPTNAEIAEDVICTVLGQLKDVTADVNWSRGEMFQVTNLVDTLGKLTGLQGALLAYQLETQPDLPRRRR